MRLSLDPPRLIPFPLLSNPVGVLHFPRNHRRDDAPPRIRKHADREREIVVDGIESVKELVANDGPDLGFHVDGMPVDDVSGAVRTQNSFVFR